MTIIMYPNWEERSTLLAKDASEYPRIRSVLRPNLGKQIEMSYRRAYFVAALRCFKQIFLEALKLSSVTFASREISYKQSGLVWDNQAIGIRMERNCVKEMS